MVEQIRPSELAGWFQAQGASRPLVLDVREPAELATAGIRADGFDLVVIPMMDVPARLAELDADRPVAVLCHHGARSQRVAMFLAGNGHEKVANISGGIDAWSRELDADVPRY